MAIIPSYFGSLAQSQNLQLIVDTSVASLNNQSIWRNFLNLGAPQVDLKFDSIVGRDRVASAASIVDSDAPAPLRSRRALDRYSGKIPAIKEKFRLSQDDMRNIEIIKGLNIAGDALNNYVVRDTQDAAVSGDKRVDLMLLQILSTLQVDVNLTNNPDGVLYGTVDLLANTTTQKQGVPIVWSSSSTAKPTQDIENFININSNTRGRRFGKILMSQSAWINFKNSTDVRNAVASLFNTGKVTNNFAITLTNVNEYMLANNWPPIEVVNYQVAVEVDGIVTYINPWYAQAVAFVPAGKVGTLFNALSMEKFHPVPGKSYANYGPTLVAKWCEQDPLTEFTAMEMNAFPGVDIDSVYILNTETVLASFV